MSSRHLRRLEQLASQSNPSQTDCIGEDVEEAPSNGRSNPFSLLDSEEEACSTDAAECGENGDSGAIDHSTTSAVVPKHDTSTGRAKKRKKKQNKGPASTLRTDGDPDDIDAIISEIGASSVPADVNADSSGTSTDLDVLIRSAPALKIERKHLNAENELRRVFGRHVVQQSGSRRAARDHVHAAGHGVMVANAHRFAHTPSLGLSMSAPELVGSTQVFRYVHGKLYQRVERLFFQTVESGDPDNVLSLMNAYPGHVNTVLQLSEMCRLSDDIATSRQMLERALYLLESAAHPLFSLTSGTARLHYRHHENRALFLAVFRHTMVLSDRGCHRTALEFCKLLLSLQPLDDPLAAVLLLDYIALRAREYSWILQFLEQWEPVRNLLQLPCWAYSVPLARLQLAREEKDKHKSASLREKADAGLQQALIMFPSVAGPLLHKCALSESASQLNRPPFSTAFLSTQTDALSALCCLYVERAGDLWKSLEAGSWLLEHVQQVMKLVDVDPRQQVGIQAAAEQRTTRYQCLPLSICRHIICCDIKEARAFLPQEVTSRPVLSHDPLPPADSVCDYQLQLPGSSSHEATASGPLASFFYSMLPGYDVAANIPASTNDRGLDVALDPAGPADSDSMDPAAGQQLRHSVQSLLHAMRQLLGTMAPPAELEEAGSQTGDVDDEVGQVGDVADEAVDGSDEAGERVGEAAPGNDETDHGTNGANHGTDCVGDSSERAN